MTRSYYPTEDTFLNASRGLVRGCEVLNISGYQPSIPSSDFIPIWFYTTAYTYPTQNTVMRIVSSNTSDTAVSLRVTGLDSNYDVITEVANTNGTTPVTLTNSYFRINSVNTISGNALGNITVSNNATVYAHVKAGEGRSMGGLYTVPAGHEFFLYRIDSFSATATGSQYVLFRNVSFTSNVQIETAQASFVERLGIQRRFPLRYPEKTDIQFQGKSSTSTNEMSVFVEGLLVKTGLT